MGGIISLMAHFCSDIKIPSEIKTIQEQAVWNDLSRHILDNLKNDEHEPF